MIYVLILFSNFYKISLKLFNFPNLNQNSLRKTIINHWCCQSFISHKAKWYDDKKNHFQIFIETSYWIGAFYNYIETFLTHEAHIKDSETDI